ncbi:hypothetical protein LJC22_03735 [Desulfosarcina sp. OttesenSCG-928-G10]|nr:hypothetical protein [Desulfosarcina sp. OttesenSCG-928-G10]
MKNIRKELLAVAETLSSLHTHINKLIDECETEDTKNDAPVVKTRKKIKVQEKKVVSRKEAVAAEVSSSESILTSVFTIISRTRNGITIDRLKKQTGLESRQVSNALYKLTKKGKIEAISRGRYVKKKN